MKKKMSRESGDGCEAGAKEGACPPRYEWRAELLQIKTGFLLATQNRRLQKGMVMQGEQKKKNKRIIIWAAAAAVFILPLAAKANMLPDSAEPHGYLDYIIQKEQYFVEYSEQYDYRDVVTVEYPVLSGISGEQADAVNQIFYDTAMDKVNYWHLFPDDEVKVLQEEYYLYCSDVRCSISFHSQYLVSMIFYESYAPIYPIYYAHKTQRSANVNLITGEAYEVSDVIQLDDDFMAFWCDRSRNDVVWYDADPIYLQWFLGEDEKLNELYMFRPFFYLMEDGRIVVGISIDPTARTTLNNLALESSYYAVFSAEELVPYRTESEFWELYDQSQRAGTVIPCENRQENRWLREDSVIWEYTEKKRVFRKAVLWALTVLDLLPDSTPACAASSFYEPFYQVPEDDLEDYMMLEEVIGDYEVCEGDCLWNISEQYLGSGEKYLELMEMNPDVVTDPDLIYPHTYLQFKRNVYVRKETNVEEIRMGQCRFGALPGYTPGTLGAEEAYSSFAFTGNDQEHIICRIRDKVQTGVNPLSDWEACWNAIEEFVEEYRRDSVTDLAFQHYQSERGDEIYLIIYVYTIKGERYGIKGALPIYVSHGICQTEHLQAEFVGFHMEEGMEDVIRYLAAGFEELPFSESGTESVNDYKTTIETSRWWDIPGICNSFGWIQEYFDGIFHHAFHEEPGDRCARDRIIDYR